MTCFSFGSAARVYPQECKTCTGRCTTVHRSWASSVPPLHPPLPVSDTQAQCVRSGCSLREHVCPCRNKNTRPHERPTRISIHRIVVEVLILGPLTTVNTSTAQQHRKWAICSTGFLYIPPSHCNGILSMTECIAAYKRLFPSESFPPSPALNLPKDSGN